MKTLKSIIDKKMENSEFREAFNEYEKEFQIAQQLIRIRKNLGLTQTELAKRATYVAVCYCKVGIRGAPEYYLGFSQQGMWCDGYHS